MFEPASTDHRRPASLTDRPLVRLAGGLAVVALVGALVVGVAAVAGAADPGSTAAPPDDPEPEDEEPYVEPVPEPGDEYFEAEAQDGSWVSYINPRDEYRSPYLGDGSGKLCVTLLNADGEPVVGETVPDTSVTIPTGDSLAWHTGADPMSVHFPLTDYYDRPLDADQFGTAPDVAQGDGYLDAHCIEWHGLPEDGTVEYGEAIVQGEHADRIELVGYVQQAHDAWDSDVDPIADAESYEAAGGGWTYRTDASHGQAVVVLQLEEPETDGATNGSDDGAGDDGTGDGAGDDGTDDGTDQHGDGADDEGDDEASPMPGPGAGAALVAVALTVAAIAGGVHRRRGRK